MHTNPDKHPTPEITWKTQPTAKNEAVATIKKKVARGNCEFVSFVGYEPLEPGARGAKSTKLAVLVVCMDKPERAVCNLFLCQWCANTTPSLL